MSHIIPNITIHQSKIEYKYLTNFVSLAVSYGAKIQDTQAVRNSYDPTFDTTVLIIICLKKQTLHLHGLAENHTVMRYYTILWSDDP